MSTVTETRATAAIQRVTLALTGLRPDGGGSLALEQALAQQPGVRYVYVCAATEMAYIVYDPALVSMDQLVGVVLGAGFYAETPELR